MQRERERERERDAERERCTERARIKEMHSTLYKKQQQIQ